MSQKQTNKQPNIRIIIRSVPNREGNIRPNASMITEKLNHDNQHTPQVRLLRYIALEGVLTEY